MLGEHVADVLGGEKVPVQIDRRVVVAAVEEQTLPAMMQDEIRDVGSAASSK